MGKIFRSRAKLLFALLPLMAVAFYLLTYGGGSHAEVTYQPPVKGQSIVDLMDKPESGLPTDYTPQENFAIAAGIVFNTNYFESIAEGTVTASVFSVPYNQQVLNTRKYKDGALFAEAISTSAVKKVAEQKYFANDTILYRPADSISGVGTVKWSDTIVTMPDETFAYRYGAVPRDITKYVVTAESIVSAELVSYSADEYVYRYVLEPSIASKYYKNEMRTMAGADDDPTFQEIVLTLTVGPDFLPKSILSEEKYAIKIPVLGALNCKSSLLETFSYIGDDTRTIPESEIFASYVPEPGGGDIGDLQPKSASDYLMAAFGSYMAGAPLDISADLTVGGMPLTLDASVDIASMNVRAKIDALTVEYSGDRVYLSLNDLKGYLSVSAFTEMLDSSGLGTILGAVLPDLDNLLGDDILTTLFAQSEIVKEDGLARILMPFTLAGIDFDVEIAVTDGDVNELKYIDAKLDLMGVPVTAYVVPAAVDIPAADESYRDLSNLAGFLPPAVKTLMASSYDLSADLSYGGLDFGADIRLNKNGSSFKADADLDLLGQTINLKYLDETVYASLGAVKVQVGAGDVAGLVGLITQTAGVTLPDIDLTALLPADISGWLAVLQNIEDMGNNTFRFTLNLAGTEVAATVSHDGKILKTLTVETTVGGAPLSAVVTLNQIDKNAPIKMTAAEKAAYLDLTDLAEFVGPIVNTINKQSYDIDLTASVGAGGKDYALSGNFKAEKTADGFAASALLNLFGQDLRVVYAGDTVYASLGNLKFRLATADFDAVLAELSQTLPIGDLLAGIKALLPKTREEALAMVGYLSSVRLTGGGLEVKIAAGGGEVTALLTKNETYLDTLTLTGSLGGATFDVRVSLSPAEATADRVDETAKADYTDVKGLASYVGPIVRAASQKVWAIDLSAAFGTEAVSEFSGRVVLGIDGGKLVAAGSITAFGQNIDLFFDGDEAFVAVGETKLRLKVSDLGSLLTKIAEVYPPAGSLDLSKIADALPKSPEELLGMLSAVESLRLGPAGEIVLRLSLGQTPLTLTLSQKEGALDAVTFETIAGGSRLTGKASLMPVGEMPAMTDEEKAAYADVNRVADFAAPLMDLVEQIKSGKTFTFRADLTINAGGDPIDMTADVTIALRQSGGFDLHITLGLYGQTIYLDYVDEVVYLTAGEGIRVKHPAKDTAELLAVLNNENYLPSYVCETLGKLIDALTGGKNELLSELDAYVAWFDALSGKSAEQLLAHLSSPVAAGRQGVVAELVSCLGGLSVTESGGLSLVLNLGPADATVTIFAETGAVVGVGLDLSGTLGGIGLGISAKVGGIGISADYTALSVYAPETYVELVDLVALIDPAYNTFTSKNDAGDLVFELNGLNLSLENDAVVGPDGSVVTPASVTEIKGTAKVQLVPVKETNADGGETVTGYRLNADLKLSINEGRSDGAVDAATGMDTDATHRIEATIVNMPMDGHDDMQVFVTYNGVKLYINYTSVLRILSGVQQILNIHSPLLDQLIGEYAITLDSSIFDTMNITGLDGLQKMLDDLLVSVDNIKAGLVKLDEYRAAIYASGSYREMFDRLSALIERDTAPAGQATRSSLPATVGDMLGRVLSGLTLSYDRGYDETGARNYVDTVTVTLSDELLGYPGATDSVISIERTADALTGVNISGLKANGTTVNFCVDFIVGSNDTVITSPQGGSATPADAGYNDFSSVYNLLYDVINTANMREFDITGNITLGLPVISDAVIPFDIKVRIQDDGEVLAAVHLDVESRSVIKTLLLKADSYIYYYKNHLYFVKDRYSNNWLYQDIYEGTDIRHCTPEEFLANIFDYIYFLIPLDKSIQNQIGNATGGSGDPNFVPKFEEIFKYYRLESSSAEAQKYALSLSLARLANNPDLDDLNLGINSANSYITGLSVSTQFHASILTIPLNLNATLNNIGKTFDPTISFGPKKYDTDGNVSKDIGDLGQSLAYIFGQTY